MSHYNLVHKLIPMPQTMKNPDAKAAVDKELKKLETIPAWQFATLMDICHLKNTELEREIPELQ